jgi:hypothetical protein
MMGCPVAGGGHGAARSGQRQSDKAKTPREREASRCKHPRLYATVQAEMIRAAAQA